MAAENAQKIVCRYEPDLRRYQRFRARLILGIANHRTQADNFARVRDAKNHRFPIFGHTRKFYAALAHDEDASSWLAFGREHRVLRITRRMAASIEFAKRFRSQ